MGGLDRIDHFVDWTPDGSGLIYDDGTAVMMVNDDGSGRRTVVDANPGSSHFPLGFHADLSPDGSRIVYSSCQYPTEGITSGGFPVTGQASYHHEIALVTIDGSDNRRLTENKYMDHYPAWSPDGRSIAFVRGDRYLYDVGPLRTMLADGSDQQDLKLEDPRDPYGYPLHAYPAARHGLPTASNWPSSCQGTLTGHTNSCTQFALTALNC